MSEKKQLALEIALHPYLFDHRFEGRAVLPAVEAMQLLAVSARSEWPQLPLGCIRDAAFDKFLYLDDLADPKATAVISELEFDPGGSVRAKLLTRQRSKSAGITRLKEHVRLTFGKPARPVDTPAFDRLSELPGSIFTVSAGQLYSELVPFGPAFQNIEGQSRVSEKGAVAHLSCPSSSDASGQPLGSPFVLDAAFHAACVWGQRYAGIVAFPTGFAERIVFEPSRTGGRYISRVIPLGSRGDPPVLLFDIWIYTDSGEPCERVSSLRMQDVSGGQWKPPQWVRHKPI